MKKKFDIEAFPSISMEEFLRDYVGPEATITDMVAARLKKATHKDIKELNIPYVKAVPFDVVTEESLMTGEFLLVYDGKSTNKTKRIAPYVRPEKLKKKEMDLGEVEELEEIEESEVEELEKEEFDVAELFEDLYDEEIEKEGKRYGKF